MQLTAVAIQPLLLDWHVVAFALGAVCVAGELLYVALRRRRGVLARGSDRVLDVQIVTPRVAGAPRD